jgi:uncharacterized protein DUF6798
MGRGKYSWRMHGPRETDDSSPPVAGWRLASFEVVWIFFIFFLFAGSLPPDVGESHYLVKAKHYWQPSWCAGDLFLESRDAHAAFYWTFGWVTRFCSLTATAWIGRVITWLLLAWSWRRLSWAIVPRPLLSLLSAGLMLAFLKHGNLAGEWIVGGVEAKGFAYVLVFLALETIARGSWRAALLFSGAAGAFHVLVGGWTAVAIGFAWLVSGSNRVPLTKIAPPALLGLVLALPGLVPALALNAGVPKDEAREAARIYVFDRLAHHLIYSEFPTASVARFQSLAIVWAVVAFAQRRQARLAGVQRVVAGAVVIAVAGVVIDQSFVIRANIFDQAPLDYERSAAGLLRYYWFRMSDSLVPVGLALGICAGLEQLQRTRTLLSIWLATATGALALANLGQAYYARLAEAVPPAILQSLPDGHENVADWYRDWRAVCRWTQENTPADALFLTPGNQQTFKWYAQRPETPTWKDIPQDARGIVEWKKQLDEIHPRDREHHAHDLASFSDAELVQLAHRYHAPFIVIEKKRAHRRIGLPKIYPSLSEDNGSFEVYLVPGDKP